MTICELQAPVSAGCVVRHNTSVRLEAPGRAALAFPFGCCRMTSHSSAEGRNERPVKSIARSQTMATSSASADL
jgi:hypothetical protein